MKDLEINRNRISITIAECEKHVLRIHRAIGLASFFPLNKESYEKLTEDEIAHIDQLIYRFTKLQDAMGRRLIPATYHMLDPENDEASFLDQLNSLEKYGFISDAERWHEFRILRNRLSHEYPDNVDQMIVVLNEFYRSVSEFLEIYFNFKSSLISRELLK
ncbi:MAG: hypothetical protein RQ801_04020 [Spirochaetaceae bacterium]|nr:hypothetical protein [Spirochaetaceae bacterium]MDT8297445.1 hypothetical protein [Spirochaetaceae bacterium]